LHTGSIVLVNTEYPAVLGVGDGTKRINTAKPLPLRAIRA